MGHRSAELTGRVPRLAKITPQLPLFQGGLALPSFQFYYWDAVQGRWWFSQTKDNPAVITLSRLVFQSPQSHTWIIYLMTTTL